MNEELELLNDIRNYLANKYGVKTYISAEDRLAYAVKIAYTSYFMENRPFITAQEIIKQILNDHPQNATYSGVERSVYRTLEKYSIEMLIADGVDLRRDCMKLARDFKKKKKAI